MFFKQISDLKNARILICNDDGIDAEGIKILEEETSKICGDVWVAAPDRQKSSSGHAHVSSMLLPRNCTSAEEVGQIKKLTTGILPSTARRATASIWLCVFFSRQTSRSAAVRRQFRAQPCRRRYLLGHNRRSHGRHHPRRTGHCLFTAYGEKRPSRLGRIPSFYPAAA